MNQTKQIEVLRAALEVSINEKCNYMKRNNLGDPEIEAVTKMGREALVATAQAAATCVCGEPSHLGTVHRVAGPCFVYEQSAEPVALSDEQIDAMATEICPTYIVTAGTFRAFAHAILAAQPAQAKVEAVPFQWCVQPWMTTCFGPVISNDLMERNHRFLEEALELVQSTGCTKDEAFQLVDYVYGRPVGQVEQEVGGVMVTLAALCLAQGIDMHECGEVELARIWTKVEQIRAKQAAKPKHSPLPQATPAPVAEAMEPVWNPMATAPKDGTMLRLLVNFTDNATEDSANPSLTIGANNFDHDGEDEWKFAGWNWTHDCFTEGTGTPVGWLYMLDRAAIAQAGSKP